MTILKAKNGKEIDTKQFEGKGYGVFTEYIRKNIDSQWGRETSGDSSQTKYSITVRAIKTSPCYATLVIEADTEDEAREKGLREAYRQQDNLDWDDGVSYEINDIEIDEVELEKIESDDDSF